MSALPESLKALAHGYDTLTPEQYEQAKADLYNSSIGDLNEEDGYNCDLCKNKGNISKVMFNEQFGYYSEALVPCKCNRVRNAIRRLNRSGLKNVVKEYTFDKYETPEQWHKTIKETAQRFCTDQAHDWFYIGGQSGAGKTHICTAIAVACIKQGKDARYMLWLEEIKRIKALVTEPEQYNKILKELKEAYDRDMQSLSGAAAEERTQRYETEREGKFGCKSWPGFAFKGRRWRWKKKLKMKM